MGLAGSLSDYVLTNGNRLYSTRPSLAWKYLSHFVIFNHLFTILSMASIHDRTPDINVIINHISYIIYVNIFISIIRRQKCVYFEEIV